MRSLLNKSLWAYMGCTVIVLLLTMPLFYLLTQHYYAEDLMDVINHVHNGMPLPQLDLEEDIMHGLMIQFVLISGVMSLSFLVIILFLTKRIWHPFDDTLKKIERFNLDKSEIPTFLPTDTKEFVRLNESIGKLMERNLKTYKEKKEFTENASHELQTPIAIFQSKLDLLLQEELNETQSQIISELYLVSSRMSRLNKNLLLLAKIENKQYKETELVDLTEYINNDLPLYRDLYPNHTIKLIDKRRDQLKILTNPTLLNSLITNLVINAIHHSPVNGNIEIELNNDMLSISNEAKEGALDDKILFHRYNTDKKNSNGLGLAIVKAICTYHGWQVSYLFHAEKHIFQVDFRK